MTFWQFTPAFNVAPLSANTLLLPAPPSQAAVSALAPDRPPAVHTPTPNKSAWKIFIPSLQQRISPVATFGPRPCHSLPFPHSLLLSCQRNLFHPCAPVQAQPHRKDCPRSYQPSPTPQGPPTTSTPRRICRHQVQDRWLPLRSPPSVSHPSLITFPLYTIVPTCIP